PLALPQRLPPRVVRRETFEADLGADKLPARIAPSLEPGGVGEPWAVIVGPLGHRFEKTSIAVHGVQTLVGIAQPPATMATEMPATTSISPRESHTSSRVSRPGRERSLVDPLKYREDVFLQLR